MDAEVHDETERVQAILLAWNVPGCGPGRAGEILHALRGLPEGAGRRAAVDAETRSFLLGQLYLLYATTVRRHLERLGFRADVEDETQETFMRLIDRGAAEEAPRNWPGFLCAIAYNVWREGARAAKRRKGPLGEMPELASPAATPEELVSGIEEERRYRAALGKLDDEQRAAHLLFESGLSIQEVANQLGLPYHVVRYRLKMAAQTITKELRRA